VQLYIGTGAFANQASPTVAQPTAFGTALANTNWYPQVATVTVATGSSGSTYAALHLFAPGTAGWGNQFAQPFLVFIPGPNNPACTAAGTCNLTPDRIEEARRDQYHSMVVPNMPAGVDATGELFYTPGFDIGVSTTNQISAFLPEAITTSGGACQLTLSQLSSGTKTWAECIPVLHNYLNFTDTVNSITPLVLSDTAVSVAKHLAFTSTTAPTVSSCGTSPSITGNDNAFAVTTGSGTPVACTVTFAASLQQGICVANGAQDWVAIASVSTSAVTFTINEGETKIYAHCF
jgi:hypothetical protein